MTLRKDLKINMKQSQKNYLLQRINAETLRKENDISVKYPIPSWDSRAKYEAIVRHKLPIALSLEQIYAKLEREDYWNFNVLDFFDVESVKPDIEAARKVWREALNRLHDRATRLKDIVMLGDEKDALEMLDAFMKEEF